MKPSRIVITDVDRRRLGTLIERATRYGLAGRDVIADLEHELERATAVDPGDCPSDVVTMNSTVRVRDLDRDEMETYTLVYPAEGNVDNSCLSVLSPMGTAISGYRAGDVIEWSVPRFHARLRVEEVVNQTA